MKFSQGALVASVAAAMLVHAQAFVSPNVVSHRQNLPLARLEASSKKLVQTGGGDGSAKKPARRTRKKAQQQQPEQASSDTSMTPNDPSNNNNNSKGEQELMQTLGGGDSLIFAMARRMLVWDKDETNKTPSSSSTSTRRRKVLPRWHPHSGISDVNPSFRTQAPVMNNKGYASTIWRNVRKRNKPSLWRHALRTYDRMKALEKDSAGAAPLKIQRSNIHHEGALLACAKLGLWQEALQIYKDVENAKTSTTTRRRGVGVTDNMVLSLISACIRGCKKLPALTTIEERRAPLDAAREVVLAMEEKHGLPLVARHLNPLASAYQSLGLLSDASNLLQTYLTVRTSGPEEENGEDPLNIHDMCAKDKASYSLLVKGAVLTGDWGSAVEALEDMTEAGLYPSARNLNGWTEVSERKTRQRNTRSRKKKRDEYWLESVR